MPTRSVTSSRQMIEDFTTCLDFSGGTTTNNVNLGTPAALDLTGSYSIAFDMLPRSFGGGGAGRVVNKNGGYNIHLTENSSVSGYGSFAIGNGTSTKISNANTFKLKDWSRCLITYDQTKLSVFVNGELFGTISQTVNPASVGTVALLVGNSTSPALSRSFDGLIDNVKIYKGVALGTSAAWELFNNRYVSSEGLSVNLKFNEASGTTATDSSTLGNNGNITGASYSTAVYMDARQTTA